MTRAMALYVCSRAALSAGCIDRRRNEWAANICSGAWIWRYFLPINNRERNSHWH